MSSFFDQVIIHFMTLFPVSASLNFPGYLNQTEMTSQPHNVARLRHPPPWHFVLHKTSVWAHKDPRRPVSKHIIFLAWKASIKHARLFQCTRSNGRYSGRSKKKSCLSIMMANGKNSHGEQKSRTSANESQDCTTSSALTSQSGKKNKNQREY